MIRNIIILLTGLFISLCSFSQSIMGKVVRSDNGEALNNASVYINGSTLGSSTNDTGYFKIPVSSAGQYELVVSHVGYETIVFKIEVDNVGMRLLIKMDPKSVEMRNVLVLSKETRSQWLRIFKNHFLGISEAADKCWIENEEDILFESIGNANGFKTFSEVPLIVVNEELGYRVSFDLVEFLYDPDNKRTHYIGYTRYEELSTKRSNKYEKRREKYYYGSTIHFYHSLIANRIREEGYSLRLVRSIKKDSAAFVDSSLPGFFISKPHKNSDYIAYAFNLPADSILIMKKDSAKEEILFIDWDGRLEVRYDKDPFVKNQLIRKSAFGLTIQEGFISYIHLTKRPIQITRSGALHDPMSVYYTGFWIFEKFATVLPFDYRPRVAGVE